MSKLNVMDCAPVDVEILAYHRQGGNFHPINNKRGFTDE